MRQKLLIPFQCFSRLTLILVCNISLKQSPKLDIHNLIIQTNLIIRAEARSLLEADFYTTMVPDDVRELETYWRRTTQELRVPLLEGRPDLYRRCIPVAIWGDEGSLNRSSWMLASWSLVYTYRIQTQDPLNPKP